MLQIKVSDRDRISAVGSFGTMVLALGAGMVCIGMIFLFCGANPLFAFKKIFTGSFGSVYGVKETITKAIPLILIGGGLTLAFKAKFWNIGAESQLLMGSHIGDMGRIELGTGTASGNDRSVDVYCGFYRWRILGADSGRA